jgi:hypothetical protein
MDRGLAILCHNLRAPTGMVAIHQGEAYQVLASLHCLPVGWQFPVDEIPPESSPSRGPFFGFNLGWRPLPGSRNHRDQIGSRLDQTLARIITQDIAARSASCSAVKPIG